ncbi:MULTISPECIES: DUF6881 domain-containing protein [Streptomyces]|uniref:DUF6881 domain-containing protein n=2 Tax=Streptomyces violaceusniger group TaxID=2839105 RepID=A0ABD5J991_9ACTN|nr:hypothetical protein [Streptomyces violaceusniger]KUL61904.1 hypothetical protein ADL28_14145 [Streptomyces violaceusniger]MEE4584945.1 hypothetical protein [Streptomyces sp. DSM 41602]WTA84200.1 hypothetical protein OG751_32385 [Streptomyces antimycoticus]
MEYWKVHWHHDYDQEPIVIYSEVGSDGYETRKIQEHRDGKILRSDASHESREIGLSEIPVGDIKDVAAQAEFSAFLISRADFDAVWRQARYP